jgi:hypothetical protein
MGKTRVILCSDKKSAVKVLTKPNPLFLVLKTFSQKQLDKGL